MRIVPALDRGLAILQLLSDQGGPMRVADVATALGIPRSACYELVGTLRERRFIVQDQTGLIGLGPQLLALGSSYSHQLDIGGLAQEVASEVSRRCNETVQVGVLDGRDVLYIARADSTQMVRLVSAVGRRLPAHATAIGKVLLAQLEPAELQARLHGVELEALTAQSITQLPELLEVLAEIRRTGIGLDDRESNLEVRCVAAPVRDISGACVAAISISVPLVRMPDPARSEFVSIARGGGEQFSDRLGYTPARPDSGSAASSGSSGTSIDTLEEKP